jgi:formylmethanofuran dehydrogenase subunit C
MSGLTLTMTEALRQRFDMSQLLPERLADLDPVAIAAIELPCGNSRLRLGDVFAITPGDPADLCIHSRGAKLDYVGRGMTSGRLTVEGDVGAHAGLGMRGGHLAIKGHAGAFAGAAMRDGVMEIGGNAGDFLGSGLPGERRGMTGGFIFLRGDAGNRAADRQRRGIILIEGNAGDYLGARMVAGTTIVLGKCGAWSGYAMKRGTLLLADQPLRIPPGFGDCGVHELVFLRVLIAALRDRSARLAAAAALFKQVRRFAGDASAAGKGEILLAGG